MAPEVSPPDNSLSPSQNAPDSLAVLTATAVGSIVAARMGRTPLAFAAGAAAIALLRKKASTVTASPDSPKLSEFPPAPEQSSVPHHQVQQWLTRQIEREQNLVVSPPEENIPQESDVAEDDYQPVSLLLDEAHEEIPSLRHSHYASLTEPPPTCIQAPTPTITEIEPPPSADVLIPTSPHSNFEPSTQPPPTGAGAAWLLGLEPFPSWTEAPSPAPAFASNVFNGGSLPDEIVVPTTPPTPPLESLGIHLFPQLEMINNVPETSPSQAFVPTIDVIAPQPSPSEVSEIEVQLARPGEASFDPPPPLPNPWQPQEEPALDVSSRPSETSPTSPPRPQSTAIEAEIVLRPRAPTQHSVIPKFTQPQTEITQLAPPPPTISAIDVQNSLPPATAPAAPLPRAPIQSPREQQARPTWRSWWRGD